MSNDKWPLAYFVTDNEEMGYAIAGHKRLTIDDEVEQVCIFLIFSFPILSSYPYSIPLSICAWVLCYKEEERSYVTIYVNCILSSVPLLS